MFLQSFFKGHTEAKCLMDTNDLWGTLLSLTQLLPISVRELCCWGRRRGVTGVWVAHWSLAPLLPWAEEGLCLNWFPACVGKLGPIC